MGPASPFPFSKAIKKENSPWKRPAFQYVKEVLLFTWSAFSFTVLLWPLSWPIKGFNPAPSVPGATLFTGSLEVCPSGVGTSHFVIRAAPRFSECHLHNNKQAAYPLSFRSAAPQPLQGTYQSKSTMTLKTPILIPFFQTSLEEDLRTAIEGRLFFFPRLSSLYHTRRNREQKNLYFSKLRDKQGREGNGSSKHGLSSKHEREWKNHALWEKGSCL